MSIMLTHPRLEPLQNLMRQNQVDLVLLWPSANWRYLVGHAPVSVERPTFLLISPHDCCAVVPEFDRAEMLQKTGLQKVYSWTDAQGPGEAVDLAWQESAPPERAVIALDDTMPYQYLKAVERHMQGCSRRMASEVIMELRLIKQPGEIQAIRQTSRLIEGVLERLPLVARPDMSERQLELKLKGLLLEAGVDTLDFVLVQAAPHSAAAHHMPGTDLLRPGQPVLLDIAISHQGYFSDITRQFCLGEPGRKYREVFAIVSRAQAAAVKMVKPGLSLAEVDRAARSVIAKAGYGQFFTTRTGHGLGLEVHEPPSVSGDNSMAMRAGMVFTIEPGIYLPHEFGVRIEDTIAVTDAGAKRLTSSTRELIII
jgi:Xaa-Pro aminopeptidase